MFYISLTYKLKKLKLYIILEYYKKYDLLSNDIIFMMQVLTYKCAYLVICHKLF